MTRLTSCSDAEAAAARAAAEVARGLRDAVRDRGIAHLALSGGSSPRLAYELLRDELESFQDVEVWFVDERCVPPEHEQSNFRLAREALLEGAKGLRSERVAATFDPPRMRSELELLNEVVISHHPASTVAALLLIGWLASQIGWTLEPARISSAGPLASCVEGEARAGERRLALSLRSAPELEVPGLGGVALASESGLRLALDREPGGLRARRRDPDGEERTWKLLGASRGEGGILGEGIRAALLRDPTYTPALRAAQAMLPDETHAAAATA